MITLTGDPRLRAPTTAAAGLVADWPAAPLPSSTVRQPPLPAFDFERRDGRSGRGPSRRQPPVNPTTGESRNGLPRTSWGA